MNFEFPNRKNELNNSRSTNGEYVNLFPAIRNNSGNFIKYMRMSVSTFDYILVKISSSLMKNWCNLHAQPIMPEERLVLTLRFLATGSTYSQLAFSFKMGIKTVSVIVCETMNVLSSTLVSLHMPVPSTTDFIKISQDFEKKWNFPHCMGSIDGRHVAIKKPHNSGKLYFNYKRYYSIVLQAVVDANYRYVCIDVGGFGSQHDSATFKASQLYKALTQGKIQKPQACKLKNSNLYLPYFFVGDGAYPISEFLMKPYRGMNVSQAQKTFNKRLSKARVVVENAFALTSQKWRIYYTNIDKSPQIITLIIKTTCLLHNIIIDLEHHDNVRNVNVEMSIDDDDDHDDALLEPVTGEDIRNELAIHFINNL